MSRNKPDEEKVFRELYYSLDSPQNFASKARLFKALKKQFKHLKEKDIDSWLFADKIHTLYKKRPPKNFVRRKYMLDSSRLFESGSMDIADFQSLKTKRGNGGNAYLLVFLGNFSKYLITKNLKKKGHKFDENSAD